MKAQEAEYAVLSEYCSFSAVTRARALFFQRRVRLMLYTERAHFYHRYRIRGIQVGLNNVVFATGQGDTRRLY
jgi:U3 small nucleolar RNA-associated protein 25